MAVLADRRGAGDEHELVSLLHKRLRFLILVFIVFYGVTGVLMRVLYLQARDLTLDTWANAVILAALFGLLAALSGHRRLPLRRLRAVEFVLFAVLAARLILRAYVLLFDLDHLDQIRIWIDAGEIVRAREHLFGLAHRLIANSSMIVVAYGVIVPNTWRRCAVVVTAFAAAPVVMWVAACAARGVPADYWFTFGSSMAWWLLTQIAVMSVYGAYRIESSRQEAAEARRLGQYVLREKIGGGGMGEVYLADHVLLRRPCAIKLIRPERAGDPSMLQRFEREVRATAKLTHPNTVQVFDYGHTPDGTFYYVMEHLPGLTLAELVARDGPLTPARAVHFLRQLCGALGEAHAGGLIHRDIKPGNVIVCERGRVPDVAKLLDFGLVQTATATDDKITHPGAVMGTPAYLAPEQAAGEPVDARTDVYALGALAYFLLTGRSPFEGRTGVRMIAAHLHECPEPPGSFRPGLPPELEAVVLRCLAKRPDERFGDVNELDRALAAVG